MSALDNIRGGLDTARVPATAQATEEQRRAQTRADATAYLTRKGHADLLPMLGLDGPPGARPCPVCHGPITTTRVDRHQPRYCSRACQLAAATPDGGGKPGRRAAASDAAGDGDA